MNAGDWELLDLDKEDLRIQVVDFDPVSGSIGAAVTVTHLPTGTTKTSSVYLSQRMNRDQALLELRAALNEFMKIEV